MDSLKQQCRTCYQSTKNLKLLTSFPEEQKAGATQKQKTCTELITEVCNVNPGEDLPSEQWPQFICSTCCEKLISAYEFIQQTQQVNKILKSLIENAKIEQKNDFIAKPALDIPMEIKKEPDGHHEGEFQNSVIKAEECNSEEERNFEENIQNIDDDDGKSKKDGSNVKYVCSLCGKGFSNSRMLTSHKREHDHSAANKLSCHWCDRKFTRKDVFLDHLRSMHSAEPTFASNRCDKSGRRFTTERCLALHRKKVHNSSKSKKRNIAQFVCTECEKGFDNIRTYRRHQREVHVPEDKKFTCELCNRKVTRKDNYYCHMRVVHKVDPAPLMEGGKYKCNICDTSFIRESSLTNHKYQFHC